MIRHPTFWLGHNKFILFILGRRSRPRSRRHHGIASFHGLAELDTGAAMLLPSAASLVGVYHGPAKPQGRRHEFEIEGDKKFAHHCEIFFSYPPTFGRLGGQQSFLYNNKL